MPIGRQQTDANAGWQRPGSTINPGTVGMVAPGTPGSPRGIGQPNPGAPSPTNPNVPVYAQPNPGAPQPSYFNPSWNQAQSSPPVNQAPPSPTLSQPTAPVATGMNSGPLTAQVGNMGGGLQSQQSNSQLWQGAPQYASQLYANMYSGNPGGIPSSIPNAQMMAGNPAAGVASSNMPSYLQNNLSGTPTPDTNTLNIGQNQSYLAGLNLKPQQMSYLRGAGG